MTEKELIEKVKAPAEGMTVEHVIFVRDYGQTYIARANGKTATCTAGREQAAGALARKLMGKRKHCIARPFKGNDRVWSVLTVDGR